jgi:plasmid stability protein
MAALTLKNIPDDLYARLKKSAAEHRRSINREAIVCLEQVLTSPRIDPEAFLARVRARRERLTGIYLTDEEINAAKNWGRP